MGAGYRGSSAAVLASGILLLLLVSSTPAGGEAAPFLIANDDQGRITVSSDGYPQSGWLIVFDDGRNGSISEFRLAAVEEGANLACDGPPGARAGLFEKMWGNSRGPHWLSGEWGRMAGASMLVEANHVRARVVQTVTATDALPGEIPSTVVVVYTMYHSGRMYAEVAWDIKELGVVGSDPYADNSWRLVLENRDVMLGGEDDDILVALVDHGPEGLPQLVFTTFPTFWQNGAPHSFQDPSTRETYLNAVNPIDRISDPLSGMAAARLNGSKSLGNPYRVGESFRHIFLIDWSQAGPGSMEDAAAIAQDFQQPDPLDGSPGAGRVLVGSLVTDEPADGEGDGYVEGEGCYAVSAFAGMSQCRLEPRRGGETEFDFRFPVLKISNFDVTHDFLMVLLSYDGGASWDVLEQDVDFVATTYVDESGLGQDTRVVSILRDLTPTPGGGTLVWFMEDTERIIIATTFHGPEVVATPSGVRVSWRVMEPDLYRGYHISRRGVNASEWITLTAEPLADDTPAGGKTYLWIDRTTIAGEEYLYRVEALPLEGGEPHIATAGEPVRSKGPMVALVETALTASPNPFNPEVTLSFRVPAGGARTLLEVMDIRGRVVRRLRDELLPEGPQSVSWDGRDEEGGAVISGVYLVRLAMPDQSLTKKIVMLE